MAKNHKIPKCPPLRFPDFNDEWTQTTLGEIAEILNSRRKPITSSDRVRGDYPYYGASGIIDYVNEYIFDEQLLLIGEDGAKWGKDEKTAFIVNGRCWVNNHAHVLRFQNYPTYKLIEAFFFSLNLKPFVTGDAPPKLTLENLKSILIHFPSLAEQEKIAGFLSLIDERIQSCSETIKERKREKATLLNQLFSQTLRFPLFFDEWQQTTLGEVAEITSGYSGEQEQMETPYRVSRIETISSGVIDIERVGFVSYDAKLVAYKLSLGDILFSNINSIEHIGKSAIVSRPIDLYHGMNLLRLKAINIDPYVLYYHLQRDVVRNRFRSIANKAVSQASINQTTLGKEPVLLAPTLAEQKKIAYFLSLLDERIEVEEELLEQYERQKRYLLRQMFV